MPQRESLKGARKAFEFRAKRTENREYVLRKRNDTAKETEREM